MPTVHSGDEPHYLILINSLIDDGDLDVANNYASVHTGGHDAGRKFFRWPLDHHVVWYRQEHRYHWSEAYETEFDRWNRDSIGNPIPTLRSGFPAELTDAKEYSQHSPGLAFLLAPFLAPFRGTPLVECAALLATAMMTAAGFVVFCRFIRPYVSSPLEATAIGTVAYLGSPLWHYGRTLFVEPYAATLVLCACAAILRSNRYWLGGLLLGIVCLLKGPFLFICLPFVAEALWRKDLRNAIRTALPVSIAVGISLAWNKLMWQGWLHMPLLWEQGNPIEGMFFLLFSVENGIVLFAPALIVSCCCIPLWFRQYRRDAVVVGSAFLTYFVHIGCYALWHGGYSYSARYLIPVLPLMLIPLGMLPRLEPLGILIVAIQAR